MRWMERQYLLPAFFCLLMRFCCNDYLLLEVPQKLPKIRLPTTSLEHLPFLSRQTDTCNKKKSVVVSKLVMSTGDHQNQISLSTTTQSLTTQACLARLNPISQLNFIPSVVLRKKRNIVRRQRCNAIVIKHSEAQCIHTVHSTRLYPH